MKVYCSNCENRKPLKSKPVKRKYEACGLDYVTIDGVIESTCNNCGETYYNYGDLERVHRLIAEAVSQKDKLLDGKEVRFLRTYLGFSREMFIGMVGLTSEHLSRIENDKFATPKWLDMVLRVFVQKMPPDRNYKKQDEFLKKRKFKRIQIDRVQSTPRAQFIGSHASL